MRKFISILSAAALVSSVVVVPISASAEGETVLWSDTFDTYTNSVTHYTSPEGVGNVLVDGTLTPRSTYTGIGGLTLYTTNRADDSSYFQVNSVEEDPTDLYLQTQVSRFARQSAGAYLQFNETYTAEDGKDVVLAFKIKESNSGGTNYDNIFTIGNTVVNMDTAGAALDEWHDVKVVVEKTGTSVYFDGSETAAATSSDNSINDIRFNSYIDGAIANDAVKSASHPFGYPTYCFNDMVVYTAADGFNSVIPGAEDREEATQAPTPTPEPEFDAPVLSLPADVTAGDSFTFDNDTTVKWSETKDVAQTITDINGLSIALGSRENDTQTYAEVEEYGTGKVLSLGGGRWSTVGRGPVLSFTNSLDISADTSKTTVMAFSARLSAQTETGVGRLYILKDATLSGSNADGAYRNVMAVLTTDGTGASITRGDNGTDVIGINVDADEWYVVTVMVSDGAYRVFVNGELKVKQSVVASGEGASAVTALPMLAVASGNSSSSAPYSLTRIDNILTYQGELGEKATALLPVTNGAPAATEDPGTTEAPSATKAPEIEIDAPVLAAPADTTAGDAFNFNADAENKWAETAEAQSVTDIANLTINIGSKADTTTYAAVKAYGSGNVLELQAGRFGNVDRSPRVELANTLDISESADKTSVIAFTAKLSSDGNSKLYILKDAEQTSAAQYRNVMAVLTTDGTGATITRGDNGTDVIGIDVDADVWHVVTVMVSNDAYRVFVDGEQKVKQSVVASGEGASAVTALPMLTPANERDSLTAYSNVLIDNIITYQGVLGERASDLFPTTAKAYTKYTAVYNEDKTLASVTVEQNQYEPQAYSYDEATKTAVMYWQDMTPYAAPAAE